MDNSDSILSQKSNAGFLFKPLTENKFLM